MAERTKLASYMVFSFLNTIVYCYPAQWVWGDHGFLHKLGCIDVAGAGPVHLVGGVTGLVATLIMGPRVGRFTENNGQAPEWGCPTNALLGMFMLWYVRFACDSQRGDRGGVL